MVPVTPSHPEPPRRPEQFPPTGAGSLPSVGIRFAARLFDGLIIAVISVPLVLPHLDLYESDVAKMLGDMPLWATIAMPFVPFLYEFIMLLVAGRTFGKMLFGTRVVRYVDGRKPTPTQAFFRAMTPALGGIVSLGFLLGGLLRLWEPVVYLSVMFHPIRRGLHDLAAGTIVIHD